METRRWINQSQPPNLFNATILLYINAGFAIFFGLLAGGPAGLLNIARIAGIAGGYGIANEKKWGYQLSVAVAIVPFILYAITIVLYGPGFLGNFNFIVSLIFEVLLAFLLLEKKSREYVRIWFK